MSQFLSFRSIFIYPKELRELHNDYHLAPDKKEIKNMLRNYKLKFTDLFNFSITNVEKLLTFLIKKYVLHYKN